MPPRILVPWQSFFDDKALSGGRRLLRQDRVEVEEQTSARSIFGHIHGRQIFTGKVKLRGVSVSSDNVLRVSNLINECSCGHSLMGCEHVAAILMVYAAQEGFEQPDQDDIACGRDDVFDRYESMMGSNDDERDWDDPDGNGELFDDDDDPTASRDLVMSTGRNRAATPFSVAARTKPDPSVDRGEPPPTIAIAEEMDEDDDAWEINRWLTGLCIPQGSVAKHQLAYLLSRDQQRDGVWSCSVLQARRLKSGAWGKHVPISPMNLQSGDLPKGAMGEDALLLRWLSQLADPDQGYDEYPLISAAAGVTGDAWSRLLATGRCYVEDLDHPLRQGPPLELVAIWQERVSDRPAGRRKQAAVPATWQLSLRCRDGTAMPFIAIDPPWYVADGCTGPITTSLPARQLLSLLSMPPVPTTLLPATVERLQATIPGIPAAPLLLTAGTTAAAATGHLVRWTPTVAIERGSTQRIAVEIALVAFSYAGALCDPDAEGPVIAADGSPILRDPLREAALLTQLRQLGLVPIEELDGRSTNLDWDSLPTSRPSLPGWVHQGGIAKVEPGKPIPLPPAVLAALVATGWVARGGERPPPTLAEASIEARFHDEVDGAKAAAADGDWFQLDLGVRFGSERIDLTPIVSALLADASAVTQLPQLTIDAQVWVCVALPDGRVVRVLLDLLQRLVEHLTALFGSPPGAGGWRTDPWQALALGGMEGLDTISTKRLSELASRLAGLAALDEAAPPARLLAELRPYQKVGLGWLQRLRAAGIGGVLADDMGLGKTVQAIAHICAEEEAGRLTAPVLVVGPASMVGTWRRELARFAPHLRIAVLHGSSRARTAADILRNAPQVVVTTYATLLRDAAQVQSIHWALVIADEAQAIGNPAVKSGQQVRRLDTAQRLALTGTPMSNHLGELHVLMSWLVPGLLGSASRFDTAFRRPIEKGGDRLRAELLRKRIAPFMLRRTKEIVAPELPARSEVVVTIELEGGQRALYDSVRLAMDERIRAVVAAKGLARSHLEVLDALTKLRLCCCDPRLVKAAGKVDLAELGSAKLAWLRQSLPELIEEGRRILLFSQFTSLLDLIESDVLEPAGIPWLRLDGSTRDRDTPVQRFQRGEAPIFLLSLKAGGTGLTLTAADTVIIADPWWNPAAEAQAADRAHRIGQDKPVFVWRLVAEGTVEERILSLQERKRALMAAMLDDQGQSVPTFSAEDLAALLAPLPE